MHTPTRNMNIGEVVLNRINPVQQANPSTYQPAQKDL
jgi:hypothetical protein